jgi:thiol-disulfide isomerase/thioredoxin
MQQVTERRCRSALKRRRAGSSIAYSAALALCFLASSACSKFKASGSSPSEPTSKAEPHGDPAAGAGDRSHYGVTWYEDDLDGAIGAATARGRPVFVELWAPWCHTCLSMKSFLLTRENVPALTEVVPLAINTERAENAPFLERFPVGV